MGDDTAENDPGALPAAVDGLRQGDPRDVLVDRISTWVEEDEGVYNYADRLILDLYNAGFEILMRRPHLDLSAFERCPRVLVCGSRTWDTPEVVDVVLSGLLDEYGHLVVIEGGARGADDAAAKWCDANEEDGRVQHLRYPADWDKHGKRAGYVRNQQMLDQGRPTVVYAFRSAGESKGTDMMCDLARSAGKSVFVITRPEGDSHG